MRNTNWNTQHLKTLLEDICDMHWKIEVLKPEHKFETSVLKIYHTMMGKTGPYITLRGTYMPSNKEHVFNPDMDQITDILLGDNNCVDMLSAKNKNNILTPVYQKIANTLVKLNYLPEPISSKNEFYVDGYDTKY